MLRLILIAAISALLLSASGYYACSAPVDGNSSSADKPKPGASGASGGSGSSATSASVPDPASTCVHKGKTHAEGEKFDDDCNSCTCQGGRASCTELGCSSGQGCEQNGVNYAEGDAVPSLDSCNSCNCVDGQISCTEMGCVESTGLEVTQLTVGSDQSELADGDTGNLLVRDQATLTTQLKALFGNDDGLTVDFAQYVVIGVRRTGSNGGMSFAISKVELTAKGIEVDVTETRGGANCNSTQALVNLAQLVKVKLTPELKSKLVGIDDVSDVTFNAKSVTKDCPKG